MRVYCGIDPGLSGAIAFVSEEGIPVAMCDIPVLAIGKGRVLNGHEIKEILLRQKPCFVAIEKAQPMPKQGVVSTGNYMKSYGILIGMLVGLDIPYSEVPPQRWKKVMMPDMPKEKQSSVVRAFQMFPAISFPRKKDHNKADALLIAVYGLKSMTSPIFSSRRNATR
jgi:crossover junction endodeoxyribonuclease RuvC